MKFRRSSLLTALLLPVSLQLVLATDEVMATILTDAEQEPWKCGLYLAESIIPGAGLGLFTTQSYKNGERLKVPADILIPFGADGEDDDAVMGALANYHWDSLVEAHHLNQVNEGTYWCDFVSGFGSVANHDAHYENAYHTARDADGPLYDRVHRANPGSDAYTPFHHLPADAMKDIKAGAELLISYGDNYFSHRDYGLYLGVPDESSYDKARFLMKKFIASHEAQTAAEAAAKEIEIDAAIGMTTVVKASAEVRQDADAVQQDQDNRQTQELLKVKWDELRSKADLRTQSALPQYVEKVLQSNGTQFSLGEGTRPIEEIREHGQCVDKIRIESSAIFEAGRGGFANVAIEQGEVVSPFAVAQLNRTLQLSENRDNKPDAASERLLLNYCIGHPESTLLLYPYITITMLINHASPTSGPGKPKPNAKLQLSTWKHANQQAFEMTAHDITHLDFAVGVVYDLVATKEIAPGEEIYMDYGNAWQAAWDAHVESWRPFVSELEDNEAIEPLVAMEHCEQDGLLDYTENQEEGTPTLVVPDCISSHPKARNMIVNPPSVNDTDTIVTTGCFYFPRWDIVPKHNASNNMTNITAPNPKDQLMISWAHATEDGTTAGLFPCQILALQKAKDDDQEPLYTAMVLLDHDMDGWRQDETQVQLVHSVPRRAVRRITQEWRQHDTLDHKEYISTTPIPFRHYIQVPDEAFPLAWRDLLSTDAATSFEEINDELAGALLNDEGVSITTEASYV
jgi:hypothetical protein